MVFILRPSPSNWKREFLEKGPELFGKDKTIAQYEKRIKELEQLLGRKEVEIALETYLEFPRFCGQCSAWYPRCLVPW